MRRPTLEIMKKQSVDQEVSYLSPREDKFATEKRALDPFEMR